MTDDTADGSDPTTTLSMTGASFAYDDVTVLEDAEVSLRPGEFTALIGANGSGKTTVLQLLAGLRSLDDGEITHPASTGRTIAYLPQRPEFRGGFTARETLEFYAALVDSAVDPDALLARVGLEDAADRAVGALSGGMTRLLGLSQALVGDPPVVVLDEPTSGLDPDIADHIFDVVESIASDGRLVVTASHDLTAIEARADRVLLVSEGGFALDGHPDALVESADAATLRDVFSGAVGAAARSTVTQSSEGGET
jgi:ABC-type multidrug transport system ATPase subunit